MENNFYVASIFHAKRIFKRNEYREKVVLYSTDNYNFLDLKNSIWYTTDNNCRDYVEKETIVPTDISLYREDYLYMLSRYVENNMVKKKKKLYK